MEGELRNKRLVLATFDKFNNPDNKNGEDEAQELLSQLCSSPSNVRANIADYSDEDKFTLLHHACYNGWYNVTKRLIEECSCDPNIKNTSGSLPIHLACLGGNNDLVDYIATLPGARPNDRDNSGITPLHYAVLKGCKQVVEYLIVKHNADPNSKDNSGQTPLHIACKSGHLDIVDHLVDELYCDPKCTSNGGRTPLHLACQNGYLHVAKYLIDEHNCDPACRNKNGSTPLHLACQNGHLAVAKYLVGEKHCDPSGKDLFGWTAMHSACETGHLSIVEYLIEERCSHDETSDGRTPLYLACQNGHYDTVMFLVREQHFSPDCDLWKPLCIACENGYLDIVKYLICKQPKNWKTNARVLLNYACENGHLRIVRYLVKEYHCDPTQTNRADGMTLLHLACRNGHMDVIKYLIEEKSCVPTRSNCDGWTPLHFACQNGHLVVARYLIQEQDCYPACENNSGWTPLHSASEYGHTAVVQYLVNEQYCSLTCRNRNGWTSLHLACRNGHIGVAEKIMESCDIADVDCDGCTPLHLACQSGHLDLVKSLVSNYRTKCGLQKLVEFIIHHDTNNQYKSLSSSSSPFFTALMKGHLEIVNYFVDTVVELHASKAKDCTYLHSACVIGDLDVVKYLIQINYCDPQCQDDNGWSPLHYSCKHGHIQIVEHLVNEQNCEVVCYTNDRSTPFSIAVDNNHDDVALFLIQKQFSHLSNSHLSLLHSACQVGELEIVKFLVKGKHVDPHCRDSNGLAPLHVACENGHLDIVKYLTQEVDCDPMCMTSDAWTPLHSASKNGRTNILKYLIEEKQCNSKCKAFKSITPLHLACRCGHLDSVVYLINCHSSMLHDNSVLDEALSSGNDDIVLLLLSHGLRLSSNVQYGVTSGSRLVQPALKVFLLGNPMSGKSTLVQAVLSNLAQDGWLNHKLNKLLNPKVTGVDPYTAGIIPHHFHNPHCGYLILYDFAGQYEHYSSSHAAVLEHLSIANSCTGCLVLIFVDISKQEGKLIEQLQYWNSFILNQYRQDIQPRVVVIGSHVDKAKSDGEEKLCRALAKVPDLAGSTVITLDCTRTSSTGLTSLCSCLSAYSSQHMKQFKIGAQTHFLNRLLRQEFKDQIACQLCDISGYINSEESSSLRKNNLLPTDSASLIKHLSILNEQGQVIFMKDCIHIDDSWIILNEEVLLSHINGSMFAPDGEGFRSIHKQFSSTGVVALSKINKAFTMYNSQMLIGFMTHLDFCRRMEQSEVLIFGDQQNNADNEIYYFFPALVNVKRPIKSCLSIVDMKDKKYKCGWCLCCPSGKFFTSRFLHVLLLDVAFSHALPAEPVLSTLEVKCRQCNIWRNGIHWQNNDGVEALVEVVEQNTAVILIVGCLQGREMECTQHRSRLIHNILRIKRQYSGAVECEEAFIHPNELSVYPLKTTNSLFTFSINQLATAILDKKQVISSKLGTAQEMIEISDILYFEPFTCLNDQIVSCLCSESCAEKEVSDNFLHDCAKVAYRRRDLIEKAIILFPEQESELIGEMEQCQDQYSKDPIHQCFLIFRTWKKFTPIPTFKGLRETLDKYSVFRGRNPLVSETDK